MVPAALSIRVPSKYVLAGDPSPTKGCVFTYQGNKDILERQIRIFRIRVLMTFSRFDL